MGWIGMCAKNVGLGFQKSDLHPPMDCHHIRQSEPTISQLAKKARIHHNATQPLNRSAAPRRVAICTVVAPSDELGLISSLSLRFAGDESAVRSDRAHGARPE